jgi:hypothetical protein
MGFELVIWRAGFDNICDKAFASEEAVFVEDSVKVFS